MLVIGVVCLIVGGVNLANAKLFEYARSPAELDNSQWYYSFNLTTGKTYRLRVDASQKWGELWGQGTFDIAMPANITITSPTGGVTRLQAFYFGFPSGSQYYRVGTPPTVIEVRYQEVDDNSLIIDRPSMPIRFAVRQNGFYVFRVLEEGFWSTDPPKGFVILEEVVPDREAYSVLVAGGGVVGVVGGVVFAVGTFGRKGVRHRKMRK